MKYLMLNGSPHRGNTWKLAELIRGRLEAGDDQAQFEYIDLADVELPMCAGCSNCFRLGGEYCPHYKVMGGVLDKLEWCDCLVLAVTTFFMQPTALLKNLIDHMCYFTHRPHFFAKKAIVLSTTGGIGAQSTVKYVCGWLGAIGFNKVYKLGLAAFSWNAYSPGNKAIKQCEKIGDRLSLDVTGGKLHQPSFGVLIPYNLFRGMCRAYAPGTQYATRDGVFWTHASRKNHAYDQNVPISFVKRIFGSLFCFVGHKASKYMTVTYKR